VVKKTEIAVQMKCTISENTLVVRHLYQAAFRALPDDIRLVRLIASHRFYGPTFMARFFGNSVELRFILLRTDTKDISLDLRRDVGAADVIAWLRGADWDIEAALQEAIETPLVRITVHKLRSY
jgi:hypothetical protein